MPRKSATVLTAKMVETAKPPRDRAFDEYPDAALPGFCLRVYRTGGRSYILSTRVAGKLKRRKIADATGSDAIPLAEARRRAADAKDTAKAGKPLPRFEAPTPPPQGVKTFGEIAEDYIARECARLARGNDVAGTIRRELLPTWRRIPLPELRKRHARELTDALAKDRPAAAHKLHEIYCRVLNWALGHYDDDELGIEVSPFANLKPPVSKTARAHALKPAEIATLWRAWTAIGYPFGDVQKLLLLTAQRRGEVAEMEWGEIDLAARIWTIPAQRSKSRREHIVPLSNAAADILAGLPRFGGGPFAFTTTGGQRPVSGFSKAKSATATEVEKLVKAGDAEPVADWRIHDLRRTARTGMAELGIPEIVCERVLNHAPRGLPGIYNRHEYQAEKADALDRWAQRVNEIVTPPPANVLKMREAV